MYWISSNTGWKITKTRKEETMVSTGSALSVSGIFSDVTSFVTTGLLPSVVAMIVLSISIALAIKTVRRFAKKLV